MPATAWTSLLSSGHQLGPRVETMQVKQLALCATAAARGHACVKLVLQHACHACAGTGNMRMQGEMALRSGCYTDCDDVAMQGGKVWEKAGVNVSVVYGSMPAEAYRAATTQQNGNGQACPCPSLFQLHNGCSCITCTYSALNAFPAAVRCALLQVCRT